LCAPETRIVIAYYNSLWAPVFAIARGCGEAIDAFDQAGDKFPMCK
jgi:hypothetical protein